LRKFSPFLECNNASRIYEETKILHCFYSKYINDYSIIIYHEFITSDHVSKVDKLDFPFFLKKSITEKQLYLTDITLLTTVFNRHHLANNCI